MILKTLLVSSKLWSHIGAIVLGFALATFLSTLYWKSVVADRDVTIAQMNEERAINIAKIKDLELRAQEKTVEVVTEYVDRVKVVKEKGETIIKEVPVYVTKDDDANCSLSPNWVRIHNKAAVGSTD